MPSYQSYPTTDTIENDGNKGILDVTLIMGTIIDPVVKNDTIKAKALYVFYYKSGIFIERAGVVRGLTEIEFTKTPFLLIYSPGPFGYISYVYGFAKDLTINE